MEHQIRTAIRQRRLIEFRFDDLGRLGEPHLLGIHKGVRQVLVYQTGGGSRSGRLPSWRRFAIDGLRDLRLLDTNFTEIRLAPGPQPDWDEVLAIVG